MYLYLITNPDSKVTGICKIRPSRIACDCNLDKDIVFDCLFKLAAANLIYIWDEKNLVYIKNHFHFQKGIIKNPEILLNVIKRQKELIQNSDAWKLFEEENKEDIELINKRLIEIKTNKAKAKDKANAKTSTNANTNTQTQVKANSNVMANTQDRNHSNSN